MRVSILTPDSKMPNLAAMKISAFHKERGDEVVLNMPLMPAYKTYASILFEWTPQPIANMIGGPGVNPETRLHPDIDKCRPDYSLYPDMDYSLGYTYRACHRGCAFCKVPLMNEPKDHCSIWDFHDPRFKKIALLNNNTFEDPRWRETFEEIWDAGLRVKDIGGYDARLMDEEKAEALARTKFDGQIHLAFDNIKDEEAVTRAIGLMTAAGIRGERISVYILMGFDSTETQNIERVRIVRELGALPFAMLYQRDRTPTVLRRFARVVTRPAISKGIDWSRVKTYEDVLRAA